MSLEYKPVKNGRAVAGWVKALKGKSGVYIIRERGFFGTVLYVGESHTGRLYSTLLRHFQHWTGPTAGPTFPVSKVEVAIIRAPAGKAVELQNAVIAEYKPKHNVAEKPKGFFETIFGGR
jgi:excinuclease UvrABC nuclease subunit